MIIDQQGQSQLADVTSYPDWVYSPIVPLPGQDAGAVEGGVQIIVGSSVTTTNIKGTIGVPNQVE